MGGQSRASRRGGRYARQLTAARTDLLFLLRLEGSDFRGHLSGKIVGNRKSQRVLRDFPRAVLLYENTCPPAGSVIFAVKQFVEPRHTPASDIGDHDVT